jgi:large subunit ribosomal protein L10
VKGGNYAGKQLDVAGVTALASIPSREVLIAQLLGVMQAPVSGFARVLAAWQHKKAKVPQLLQKQPKNRQRLNKPAFLLKY